VSFFEKAHNAHFNSLAMIDADGALLGVYRKSHIPDGPGYQEKFYFTPGDTGFQVWDTRYGRLGVAICWDQWFPEAARAMVLQGAEVRDTAAGPLSDCCWLVVVRVDFHAYLVSSQLSLLALPVGSKHTHTAAGGVGGQEHAGKRC
jgi:predicted amidohydrolase